MPTPANPLNSLPLDNLDTLRQLVNELPVACFLINRQHEVIAWNRACASATDFPADKMVGTRDTWRAFYTERRPTLADLLVDGRIFEELQTYYAGKIRMSSLFEGVIEIEAFFPRIGPHGRWLYATVAPVRNAQGDILGAIEVLQDIHDIRLAEVRTRTLFDASPDAMLVVDARGIITMANQMASRTFGYPEDALVGLSVDQLVPLRYRAGHPGQRDRFMQGEHTPGYQMAGQRPCRTGSTSPRSPASISPSD